MSAIKAMLLGLLAILAIGSVASATASAEQFSPWWRHPETKGSQKQLKYPPNEGHQTKLVNEGALELKTKLLGMSIAFKCGKAGGTGELWNGRSQGEHQVTISFGECSLSGISSCNSAVVEIEPAKMYSELMWKRKGDPEEQKKVFQQKVYDVFAPTNEAKAGKALLTNVVVKGTECAGTYPVETVGSETELWDRKEVKHTIAWATAAEQEPQQAPAAIYHLKWSHPNVIKVRHENKQFEAKLLVNGTEAEMQGRLKFEQDSQAVFEAFTTEE